MSGASGVRTGAPGSPVGFAEDAEVLHPTPREFRVTRVKAPRVWIIDEEWDSVDVEIGLIRESYPDAQILHSSYNYEDDLDSFGRTCDVLIAQVYAPLPASTIERLECCRGIAVMGGGFDRVDVGAAGRRGIAVTNVQGYCAEDLAQYVLTAILTHAKPLVSAVGPEGPRPWGLQAYPVLPRRVADQTLLIVGYGRIGRTVARRARALGMRVLATDPRPDTRKLSEDSVELVAWDEGFRRADVVSVHCALTDATAGIIGEHEFALMGRDSLLVNTARGAILDERALADALRSGAIGGAVLDVVTHEPPDFTEEIFRVPGVFVTPHVSYVSYESISELRSRSVRNALAMFEGAIPDDCVNGGALPPLQLAPSDGKNA